MRRTRTDILAFCLLWIPYALLVRHFWFLTDDAFIAFRYARNLANGFGLRYNPSELIPVEGYSDFLWILLCAIFEYFRLDMLVWPPLASFSCGSLLLWLVYDVLRRHLELGLPTAALATLALGCFPPFALWSTSGLETTPFALLIFAVFERLILRKRGPDAVGGGILGLLLSLIRLEGLAWFLVIMFLAVVSQRRRPQGRDESSGHSLLPAVFIVGVGYACYFAWRYWYHQLPLPNTVYAKGEMTPERLLRGVNYAVTFVLTFLTPLLMIPGTWLALHKPRVRLGLATAAMAWAFPAYAILVTGDFMVMGRFLIPGLAFNTILLAWMLNAVWGASAARRGTATLIAAVTITLGLLPALPEPYTYHPVPQTVREQFRFRHNVESYKTELDQWHAQSANTREWGIRGKALRAYVDGLNWAEGEPSYVAGAVGAVGYYSDLFIFDKHGLVTPEVARRATSRDEPLRSPGHDKYVPTEYFLKDRPTILEAFALQADEPRDAAQACARQASRFQSEQLELRLDREYVIDCARVRVDGLPLYLVAWVRIADGVEPASAWSEFRKKLEILTSGEHLRMR